MPAVFDVAPTLGAMELGVLLSYLLFGVTTTQSYVYFTRFPKDDWKLKLLVAFVWACEATHAACVAHALYVYTILEYGNPRSLIQALPLTFDTAVLFASFITTIVQGFFAYRIYVLGKRRIIIPAIVWTLSTLRLIASLGIFGGGVRMKSLVTFEAQFGWIMMTVWAIGAANDIGITLTLVYLLWTQRNSEIHHQTIPLIDKLIVWAIETGMMTSACAILTVVFFAMNRKNFVWLAVYIVTARVFSNSLLASLNGRTTLRAMHAPTSRIELQSSSTGNPTTKSAQMSMGGIEFQGTRDREALNYAV